MSVKEELIRNFPNTACIVRPRTISRIKEQTLNPKILNLKNKGAEIKHESKCIEISAIFMKPRKIPNVSEIRKSEGFDINVTLNNSNLFIAKEKISATD